MVWSRSLTSIADEFGVGFHELKKKCIECKIPLPKMGHWAKIRHGRKIPTPPLPTKDKGEEVIKFVQKEKILSPLEVKVKKIEESNDKHLKVPSKLSKPHRYIIHARKGLLKTGRNVWDGHIALYDNELDIKVSPNSIGRALRFMDSLIKLLLLRGHDITKKGRKTYTVVFGEEIQIRLFESRKVVESADRWESRKLVPNGIFRFQYEVFWTSKEISDGRRPLEEQLSKILARLEIEAKKEIERKIGWEKEKKIREEKERVEQELKERRQKELDGFEKIVRDAHRWHRANILRGYINELVTHSQRHSQASKKSEGWIQWAREKIDWYDPFIEKEDSLLDKGDRVRIDGLFI